MKPQLYFAVSLLTILSLTNTTPATAQRGTINFPPSLPAIPPLPPSHISPSLPSVSPLRLSPAPPRQLEPDKPIVVAELVEQLRTANVEQRRNIIDKLSETEQNIVPELLKALEDADPLLKSGVAEVLGNHTDAAVPAILGLIRMINDEREAIAPRSSRFGLTWMQLATSWALLKLGQNQGLPVVGRLLQHPDASIQQEALFQLRGYGSQSAPYLVPYYSAQLDSANDDDRNGSMYAISKLGLAALDLVPKLRALLISNLKNSPGYAATTLGQIARDTAVALQNGNLAASGRQQAIAEFTNVLNIMQAPNARFNREPVERVRNALTILTGVTR